MTAGMLFQIVLFIVVHPRIISFVLLHPAWCLCVYRGYRQYMVAGGDFLDTDFYKVTMGQLIWHYFDHIGVRFSLTIREDLEFPLGFAEELRTRVDEYASKHHSISPEQAKWLKGFNYLNNDYIDELANTAQPKIVASDVIIEQYGGKVRIEVDGPWKNSSWWEIPLMQIVSRVYLEMTGVQPDGLAWVGRAWQKGRALKNGGAVFSEFGSRRRFSFFVQFVVLLVFIASGATKGQGKAGLLGTSNVFLAQLLRLTPIGTMAHELFMVTGAIYGYDVSHILIPRLWIKEFTTYLGYALPDTNSTVQFLKDCPHDYMVMTTGARQDSGKPIEFAKKLIAFYRKLGVPDKLIAAKSIVFSDSLNVKSTLEILAETRKLGIGAAFGIGTEFTNDIHPLKIVVKPLRAYLLSDPKDWRGCAKVSDDRAKITGDLQVAQWLVDWLDRGERNWPKPLVAAPVEWLRAV